MKFAVIVFPGSNCDHDAHHAISKVLGAQAEFVWHKNKELNEADVVILPGGFSYGDYLRTGSIAAKSKILNQVKSFADKGGLVLGICNGFQILTETNSADMWANLAIGNEMQREIDPTTNPSGENNTRATQVMRPLGSNSSTDQGSMGSVRFHATGTQSVTMDYVVEWFDATPTYHVIITGTATISMPLLANCTNGFGHGLILDQWNEIKVLVETCLLYTSDAADE